MGIVYRFVSWIARSEFWKSKIKRVGRSNEQWLQRPTHATYQDNAEAAKPRGNLFIYFYNSLNIKEYTSLIDVHVSEKW